MPKLAQNTDKLPPKRGEHGRLLPGRQSINPAGRPKRTLDELKRRKELREWEELEDAPFNDKVDYLLAEGGSKPLDELPDHIPTPDRTIGECKRNPDGTFAKGSTMTNNPKIPAKPRIVTPEDVRRRIGKRIHKVIDTLFEQAEAGETAASKLLLDRFVPSLKMTANVSSDINTLPRLVVVSQDAHEQVDKALVTDAEIITEDTAGVSDVPREIRDKD